MGDNIYFDGEYVNEVQISWSDVDAVDDYKIYRDSSWMGIVPTDQLEYTDIIAESDVVYEYCIEAVNNCGDSPWQCDTGYTILPGGDVNADGSIDVLDIVVMVNIIIVFLVSITSVFTANIGAKVASKINKTKLRRIFAIFSDP